MSRLSDIAPDELVVQLEGRIYYNPMAKTYEIADRFIAGNVIEKAEWIANYLTEHPDDEASRRSLDALKEHTPTPLTFDELDINLGVRWLDTSIYADFARELFGLEKKPQVIYIEKLDEFDITTNERNAAISEEYCVKGQDRKYDGLSLLIYALHNTLPDITKCIGYDENNKPVRVKDAEAVQLADAVVNRIRQAFSDWLQERPEAFRQQLTDRYNRLFNCIVRPRYDGSFQSFPGLDLKGLGNRLPVREPERRHMNAQAQRRGVSATTKSAPEKHSLCVWRHMKCTGWAWRKKPLIIGLKANVHEIAETFRTAYPDARLLYPGKEDFTPENRVRIFNDIKNNNWDCVILTHDQFGKLPQSPQV